MNYSTEQEAFWAGTFGNEYLKRNRGSDLLASNLAFFSKALQRVMPPARILEFGANVGMNLRALSLLYPRTELYGIEINARAATALAEVIGQERVMNTSILEYTVDSTFDLTLIKGVLIHIDPASLPLVYDRLYASSSAYLLVAEYYNPSPATIPYRGHENRLFKRDFAGELLDRFADLRLVDYGFTYHRDPVFPQDDITWFLLKKGSGE